MGEALGDIIEAVIKAITAADGTVDLFVKVLIGVVGTLAAIGIGKLFRWASPRLKSIYGSVRNIERANCRITGGKGTLARKIHSA